VKVSGENTAPRTAAETLNRSRAPRVSAQKDMRGGRRWLDRLKDILGVLMGCENEVEIRQNYGRVTVESW